MVRRQFLTPPSLPAESETRCLVIPSSKEWLGIFNDALLMLAQAHNYEQVNATDLDAQTVADLCYDIYVQYLEGTCGVMDCAEVVTCIYPVGRLTRYSPTTGELQESLDGGETWEDIRNQDPRFTGPRTPIDGSVDCDQAKYIVGYVQEGVSQMIADINAGAAVAGIAALWVGFLAVVFTFGAAAPLAASLGAALAGISGAAISAAFTAAVWTDFLCLVYCTLAGSDTVTDEHYDAIYAGLPDVATGIAYTVLEHVVWLLGPVGMQNAIALQYPAASVPANCSGCVCETFCTVVDWSTGQLGWVAGPNAFISWSARYVAGSGWGTQLDDEVMNISYDLGADVHLTHFKLSWIGTGGPSVAYDGWGIAFYRDGALVLNVNTADTHNSGMFDQDIDVIADTIYVAGNVSVNSPGNYLNFRATVAEFSGDGSSPFLGEDCP